MTDETVESVANQRLLKTDSFHEQRRRLKPLTPKEKYQLDAYNKKLDAHNKKRAELYMKMSSVKTEVG